jgi:hypothetical protein
MYPNELYSRDGLSALNRQIISKICIMLGFSRVFIFAVARVLLPVAPDLIG